MSFTHSWPTRHRREACSLARLWKKLNDRQRKPGAGTAADLLRVNVARSQANDSWPRNPRALAGHLRRAQTFLRALGIDIAFSRDGRAGSRVIRMRSFPENTVSTVSSVSDSASGADSDRQP